LDLAKNFSRRSFVIISVFWVFLLLILNVTFYFGAELLLKSSYSILVEAARALMELRLAVNYLFIPLSCFALLSISLL